MTGFTRDQKIAMLVVPMLLFGVLGVSYAGTVGRTADEDEGSLRGRTQVHGASSSSSTFLRDAIESGDYTRFVSALTDTPYHESATPEVFDTLVRMYMLHTSGKHAEADTELQRALYDA
jgi:hypothetical protein